MTNYEEYPKRAEVNGTKAGPELAEREHYDVEYWLERGGEEALRELVLERDEFSLSKVLWDARDEYILADRAEGPVGMTLSGSKADNVLEWIDATPVEKFEEAFTDDESR